MKIEKQNPLKQNLSVPTIVGTAPLKKGSSQKKIEIKMEGVIKVLRKRNWTIGVMESCTGGVIANCITNVPGALDVFGEGKVTYSVEAKIRAGVDKKLIEKYGVASKEVAEEMAGKVEAIVGIGVTGNLPGKVYISVRVKNKIVFEMLEINSKLKNKIEARMEMKKEVVKRIVEMIIESV